MIGFEVYKIDINKMYSIHLIEIDINLLSININELNNKLDGKCDYNDINEIYKFIEYLRKNLKQCILLQYTKIYVVKSQCNFLKINILDSNPIKENTYLALELILPKEKKIENIFY